MPILHGVNASPFVRKVRVALAVKGIDYDLNPVMPMGVSDEYRQKSPLGKVPCYEDGDLLLPDSSVILAYLERLQPEPALLPADPARAGRALWYEEYGDTKLVETLGPIFFERVIKPNFMNAPTDEERVATQIAEAIPPVLDYLEGEAPAGGDGIVGGRFSVADIGLGSPFVNARHGGFAVDAARWPRLAAYVEAVTSNPFFKPIVEEEVAQFANL